MDNNCWRNHEDNEQARILANRKPITNEYFWLFMCWLGIASVVSFVLWAVYSLAAMLA